MSTDRRQNLSKELFLETKVWSSLSWER